MKFLADENIARRIVQWLRDRGEDVLFAAEEKAGELDPVHQFGKFVVHCR
jgi:hypothetical protein